MQEQLGQGEVWRLGQGCKLERRLSRNTLGMDKVIKVWKMGFVSCVHSYSAAGDSAKRRHVAFMSLSEMSQSFTHAEAAQLHFG